MIGVSTTLGKKVNKQKQNNKVQHKKHPKGLKGGEGFAATENLETSHLGCQVINLAVSWKPAPAQLLLYKIFCSCYSAEWLFCCSEKQPLLA